jgi:hypothetical protein
MQAFFQLHGLFTGKVVDANGAPIPGVSVKPKGGNTGTATGGSYKRRILSLYEEIAVRFGQAVCFLIEKQFLRVYAKTPGGRKDYCKFIFDCLYL